METRHGAVDDFWLAVERTRDGVGEEFDALTLIEVRGRHGELDKRDVRLSSGTSRTARTVAARSWLQLSALNLGHDYPFLNPGLEPHGPGRVMTLIDPASNLLRFFERNAPPTASE